MKIKLISCIVILGLLVGAIPVAAQSTATPLAVLNAVETLLYGQAQSGALLARIEQIENEVFGETHEGPVMTRIDRIDRFLTGDMQASGIRLQLNLVEWGFSAELTAEESLLTRLEKIETDFFGAPQEGALTDRVEQMMLFLWGKYELDFQPIEIEPHTLVEIQMLT